MVSRSQPCRATLGEALASRRGSSASLRLRYDAVVRPGIIIVLSLVTSCSKDSATQTAEQAKEVVVAKAGAAKTVAVDTTTAVGERLATAYATGKRVKSELDKVYKTTHDYDLAVDDVAASSPEGEAHAKDLAALPSVTVGDVKVGYREDVSRSVGGVTYAKHFRATWRRGDRVYRVSYFTSEQLDAVAFADLVQRVVPLVEKAL